MPTIKAPTSQLAGVRPISFILDNRANGGDFLHIPLIIRPEDLSINEPARVAVNQTLGRGIGGWVDHFGEGLPSATISGHTGWRRQSGSDLDGMGNFELLNQTLVHDYPALKQDAIDNGRDPADVKLLFVDALDNCSWEIVLTNFVLKRNRSRPLLFQYNISMQAVMTTVEAPQVDTVEQGDVSKGADALTATTTDIQTAAPAAPSLIDRAVSFLTDTIAPIGSLVKQFMDVTTDVFQAVTSVIRAGQNAVGTVANDLIGIARDLAQSGINIFRTVAAIRGIPDSLKNELGAVAAAYNEAFCILSNSLRAREVYEDYTGLYGASNCSSTTGGSPKSAFANLNVFELIRPKQTPYAFTPDAMTSVSMLKQSDPVLFPLAPKELGRYSGSIASGYGGVSI